MRDEDFRGASALPDELETKLKQLKQNELTPLTRDLSVFQKLELDRQPVGVKFLFDKPDGVPRLGRKLPLCAMVGEAAETGSVFYADYDNHECVGTYPLGMVDFDPFTLSGQIAPILGVYDEARVTKAVYKALPRLERGTCNYTVFAPLDKLSFDPDVLVLCGTARQMEIVLRAMAYSTGQLYESRQSGVVGCAWTLVYPYLSQKVNFLVRKLAFGQIAENLGKDDDIMVSVPWNWLATIVENLGRMQLVPPAYTDECDGWGLPIETATS
jgi:uncharacterized protein (DUF169 family)